MTGQGALDTTAVRMTHVGRGEAEGEVMLKKLYIWCGA